MSGGEGSGEIGDVLQPAMAVGGFQYKPEGYDFMMKGTAGRAGGFPRLWMKSGGHAVDAVLLNDTRSNLFDDHTAEEWQQMKPEAVTVSLDVARVALAAGDHFVFLEELFGNLLEHLARLQFPGAALTL